ncbi:MAG: FAD/NAD(P)-binding protein [Anaerolineae bacterium]|nr:FAD/NAD(P)-binding protein [Anaerolineae bacterium]MDW7990655.1 FAD/NAD(P)-binding protein [Anaerolineae bacterium]
MALANPMRPYLGRLVGVRNLATGIKLFQVELLEPEGKAAFADYQPGQFAFLSAFGAGEAPFGLASTPARGPYLEFAVNAIGHVTNTLHTLDVGDPVGVRGPLGRGFPMEQLRGRNIVIIGGGIGGAPLRPVIQTILDRREDYGHLTILWAARSPDLLIFTEEFDEWRSAWATEFHVTVDRGDERWRDNVGLITQLLEKVAPSPQNAVAITCGPPIMIHFVFLTLKKLGFSPDQMLTTLEARMHCGIGKCGRCNLGEKFICTDGPVFWQYEIAGFLEGFL